MNLSERNKNSFETIEQSVYVVVLDDPEVHELEQVILKIEFLSILIYVQCMKKTFLLGETGNPKNRLSRNRHPRISRIFSRL